VISSAACLEVCRECVWRGYFEEWQWICNDKILNRKGKEKELKFKGTEKYGAKISCCDLGKKKEERRERGEKEERKKGKRERGRARVPSECHTVSTEPRR
jgi:hypothetical protein